ncbi:hypothetical protein QZH41_000550 [Actinostola sp. cb2023]|nr:hypothetical protein QZH41_000550 [Actinostola sp. cb2023]
MLLRMSKYEAQSTWVEKGEHIADSEDENESDEDEEVVSERDEEVSEENDEDEEEVSERGEEVSEENDEDEEEVSERDEEVSEENDEDEEVSEREEQRKCEEDLSEKYDERASSAEKETSGKVEEPIINEVPTIEEKYVVGLDSKSGDFVKPTAFKALAKMGSLLMELDSSLDLGQWRFIVNRKEDIPQQKNDYDCGVFTCMYARSLNLLATVH